MKTRNLLWNVEIGLIGPVITSLAMVADKGARNFWKIILFQVIAITIAVVVTIGINSLVRKSLKWSVWLSIIISEVFYGLGLYIILSQNRCYMVWLLPFLLFVTLPIAATVCYGVSKIIQTLKTQS